VSSQAIPPQLRRKIFEATDSYLKNLQKEWITSYETFRGDSFQCQCKSPELALRVVLIIRAFFKSYTPEHTGITTSSKGYFATEFDIRVAAGIGPVDFINKNKIATSDGQAFRLSGEALDQLKQQPYRMAIKTGKEDIDRQLEPSILLLDAVIQKWTQNGAEIILYSLQNKKEDEIAAILKISQSAVNQRKKNAQWFAIERLIQYFESTVQSWF
jgi:hypothetical protein